MLSMTEPKKPRKPRGGTPPKKEEAKSETPKPKPNRTGTPLHVWIDTSIADALEAYLKATEPSVFKTAAVESALRDFLRRMGFWPPKREGGK